MDMPSSSRKSSRRHSQTEKSVEERALVRVFEIDGENVSTRLHHCLIVGRTREALRLISQDALPVGERVDITFDLDSDSGSKTFSGIPRNLAVAYESSGFLVDVDLICDWQALRWKRQFH